MKKLIYLIAAIVILGLIVSGCLPVVPPTEQNESSSLTKVVGTRYVPCDGDPLHTPCYTTIQAAINAAAPGDTILVAAGTYDGFIVGMKTSLTIQSSSTVIVQGVQVVTTNYGDRDAVIFVKDSENIVLEGLTIGPNTGQQTQKDYSVIYEYSSGEINNCSVSPGTVGDLNSVAIGVWDDSDITIDSCTIEGFGRIGVFFYNGCTASVLNSTIIGQVYGGGGQVCYGIEVEAAAMANQVTITGNEIYNCDNTFSPAPQWGSSGILINGWLEYGPQEDSTVIMENNDIHDNYGGIYVVKSSSSYAHCNNIYDNRECGVESAKAYDDTTAVFDATHNWWGHATGPFHSGNPGGIGDAVSDYVDYSNWAYIPDFCDCEAKTIGYWKNHPEYVEGILIELENSIEVGTGKFVGVNVYVENIFTKPHSKTYSMLAAQLLAAKLNVAQLSHFITGYEFDCVSAAIIVADDILNSADGHSYDDPLLKPDKVDVNIIKDVLDEFNNYGCEQVVLCPCECYY